MKPPEHSQVDQPSDRRSLIALCLILFGIYGLSTGGHIYSVDDELKYEATRALAHGEPSVPITYESFPMLYRERPDGEFTTVYGIGQSVIALPFYAVGRTLVGFTDSPSADIAVRTTVLLTNSLIGALIAAALVLLCRELGASQRSAILLAVCYSVGTYALPLMKTFGSEPGTALCLTAGTWLVFKAHRTGGLELFALSAFVVGTAALFRVSSLVFLPIVGLYVVASARQMSLKRRGLEVLSFSVGGLASLAMLGASNVWRYGRMLEIGYGDVDTSYPLARGVVNLLFSPGKSIFLFAPVTIVVLAAIVRYWRRVDLRIALLITLVAVNTYTIARLPVWAGDHAWGPRYVQVVLPLIVAVGSIVAHRSRWRAAISVAALVGFLVPASLGTLIYFDVFFIDAANALGSEGVPSEHYQPMYAVEIHSDPAWNQILGHAKLVPEGVRDVVGAASSSRGPYSSDPVAFYGYFGTNPRIDFWWLWVEPTGGSPVTYLLLLPTAGSLLYGLRLARSTLRRPVAS